MRVRARPARRREKGPFRAPGAGGGDALDPSIKLDVRYATDDNFMGRPCLRRGAASSCSGTAAEALVRAHRALREKGYGLLALRRLPALAVTKLFWDVTPPAKRDFVADPRQGIANTTAAAPWTCPSTTSPPDARSEMPSAYDEFSAARLTRATRAARPRQRARRDLLRAAMEREGFTVEPNEWWHFNWRDWRSYPILDVPLRGAAAANGKIDAPIKEKSMSKGSRSASGAWRRASWWRSCWASPASDQYNTLVSSRRPWTRSGRRWRTSTSGAPT